MRLKIPWEFGDIVYIAVDPEQIPHEVVGIIYRPGDQLLLEIAFIDEKYIVHPFQVSREKNDNAHLGIIPPANAGDED